MTADPHPRPPLGVDDAGGIRRLTLDRPHARNAFDEALYGAVARSLAEAAIDDRIGVVLVTGAGRAFSAGQDLRELAAPATAGSSGFVTMVRALETFPKPLLAAVHGVAVGVGLTMLLHCDVVLASERARFRAPFVGLGLSPEAGSTVLLPAVIGWQRTARLLFTADWIDAPTALEWGLVSSLHADGALLDDAVALAGTIAAQPLASLVATKRLLLDGRADAVRAARRREMDTFASLLGGPANRAALAAFHRR